MIKGLKRTNKVKQLYHLSVTNHNGKTFRPRIPQGSLLIDEDDKHRRICFSTTMSGAFRAVECGGASVHDEVMYVHVPVDLDKIKESGELYIPSEDLVPDVGYTNEHWCRTPVKLKCIGKARFTYEEFKYFPYIPPVRIKWIEKYE